MPFFEPLRQKFLPDPLTISTVTNDIHPREMVTFWQQLTLYVDFFLNEQEEFSQARMIRNRPTIMIMDTRRHLNHRIMATREWDSPESVLFIQNFLNPK